MVYENSINKKYPQRFKVLCCIQHSPHAYTLHIVPASIHAGSSQPQSANFAQSISLMEVYKKIAQARKQKGLTQEQLADLSNVTVRTIQRIESGESMPRAYTLKAIATALNLRFEELASTNILAEQIPAAENIAPAADYAHSKHTLKIICLSCFSYLVVPFIHFLIPTRLLKKSNEKNPTIVAFAEKMIRTQLYWKVALWLLLLGTLAYNLIMAAWFQKSYLINYLVPFFAMYFINAIIISINLLRIQKTDFSLKHDI